MFGMRIMALAVVAMGVVSIARMRILSIGMPGVDVVRPGVMGMRVGLGKLYPSRRAVPGRRDRRLVPARRHHRRRSDHGCGRKTGNGGREQATAGGRQDREGARHCRDSEVGQALAMRAVLGPVLGAELQALGRVHPARVGAGCSTGVHCCLLGRVAPQGPQPVSLMLLKTLSAEGLDTSWSATKTSRLKSPAMKSPTGMV